MRISKMRAKAQSIIAALAIHLLCLLMSGCSTIEYEDIRIDQPFFGHDRRAEGLPHTKWFLAGFSQHMAWQTQGIFKRTHRAHDIVYRSKEFADKCGVSFPTERTLHSGKFPDSRDARIIRWYGEMIPDGYYGFAYEQTHVIVCLKPLVILQCDRPSFGMTPRIWGGDDQPNPVDLLPYFIHSQTDEPVRVLLGWGFEYGTTMPDPGLEGVRWYSPDLKACPQPLEWVDKKEAEIRVPWGYLTIRREPNDWLTVTTRKK